MAPSHSSARRKRPSSATSLTSANPVSAAIAAVSWRDRSATAQVKINRSRSTGLSTFRRRVNAPVSYADRVSRSSPPEQRHQIIPLILNPLPLIHPLIHTLRIARP
jgi:hypothetical protein